MNEVNLRQFQFEYDLTWMGFFQDSNGRNYSRYGGRDGNNADEHLSQESLVATMRKVLELHEVEDVHEESRYEPLVDSTFTPEEIPTMREMIGKRNESCIHCHDVKLAEFRHLRNEGELTKEMVFTYPSPSRFGLHLDRDDQNLVAKVDEDSPASTAGLAEGDRVLAMDDYRILTYADATRVLDFWKDPGTLPIMFERDGEKYETRVRLPEGWSHSEDPSWRSSVSMVGPGGGFWGAPANNSQRRNLGLSADDLALRVNFIWADHAKESGIRNGDVIVEIDGQTHNMTVRQIHAHLQMNREWGEEVDFKVRRGSRTIDLKLKLPAKPLF